MDTRTFFYLEDFFFFEEFYLEDGHENFEKAKKNGGRSIPAGLAGFDGPGSRLRAKETRSSYLWARLCVMRRNKRRVPPPGPLKMLRLRWAFLFLRRPGR